VANKLFPGFLDRYLTKKGYSGQLTDEPADPEQPDNLFDPVPGDPDTRGRFDSRAANYSLQLWATEHRGALVAGALAIAAFLTTLIVGAKPLARVYQTSSEPARLDTVDRYSGSITPGTTSGRAKAYLR
jgi:hypothetical protein